MNFGVCLETFFTDLPFPQRIGKAAAAGYRFAEMWLPDDKDPGEVRIAAEKAGVTLTNAVIGSTDGSTGGGLTSPAKREEWLQRTDATLAFCREAGIGAAIVCTGNVVEGMSETEMMQSVLDGLRETAERAERAGITLILEPLNTKHDHPGYWCDSSDKGAEICRRVGSPRMKLLFDCYHMQIMEGDLVGHIKRNLDVIGHMHSAGHPGRHELWLGETNYPFLVRKIEELGYRGVFALEYMPTLASDESLRKTLDYLRTDRSP